MALTAIYASDASSWQLSLPPKALAANNGSKFYLKIVGSQNVVLMSKKESNEEEIQGNWNLVDILKASCKEKS